MNSFLHYSYEGFQAVVSTSIQHAHACWVAFFSSCLRAGCRVGYYSTIVQVERLSKGNL